MHNNAKIPPDRSRLIVIIPRLLHGDLKRMAAGERRSVNNFINVHLPLWLGREEPNEKN